MKDIVIRFLFMAWVVSGALMWGFGLAGNDNAALMATIIFVSPIVGSLLYMVARWIVTGK